MRTLMIAIPAVILLSLAAAAQDRDRNATGQIPPPPAATTGAAIPPAPVGHRQPTQSSVPPAVLKNEEFIARQPTDPLGPLPKICNPC